MKLIQQIKQLKKIKLPFKPKGKKNCIWKKISDEMIIKKAKEKIWQEIVENTKASGFEP